MGPGGVSIDEFQQVQVLGEWLCAHLPPRGEGRQRPGQVARHSLQRKAGTVVKLGPGSCSKRPESFETTVGRI